MPYLKTRVMGEAAYWQGRSFGPLRGWRFARQSEIVWSDAQNMCSNSRLLVVRIKDAYVYRDESVVISSDYRLIADLASPPYGQVRSHDVLRRKTFAKSTQFVGTIAPLNGSKYDNFYHWMLETVPRFGLIMRSGVNPEKYLVSSSKKFQRESLNIMGISLNNTICPKQNHMLLVEDLIAPSFVGLNAEPTAFAVRYLNELFGTFLIDTKPTKRVYISRSDASVRRVVNEIDLIIALNNLRFEAVCLTDLSLIDQARLFSEADLVVGPHGAGMTNVVFMQYNSRGLIEFMPETYELNCFQAICEINGIPYQRMMSRTVDPAVHNIEVDIAQVVRQVRQTLALTH